MSKQITIRMPKPILDGWLSALRSGQYQQARGCMTDTRNGYCCLGVLVKSCGDDPADSVHTGLPHQSWLAAKGIKFKAADKAFEMLWGGTNPHLPTLHAHASVANDDGATFGELADAIEAHAEGY